MIMLTETKALPRLFRCLLTPIGSCQMYCVFKIKADRYFERAIFPAIALLGKQVLVVLACFTPR